MKLGRLMIDLEGLSVTKEEADLLRHPGVGGVILFARNFENKEQVKSLVQAIRRIRDPLLIAVDQEGGRVQRFRQGFTALQPLSYFGECYDQSPSKAIAEAEQAGFTMASEIRDIGINISFAPVLDLNWGVSEVIGSRSFHSDSNVVVELAQAYIKGMHRAGMAATGKHFPGHGAVVADSHLALPRDERDFATISQSDLVPFAQLSSLLNAVMVAHIVYEVIDQHVAGFSSFWMQDVLRKQLGFKGIIFSDDLTMAAANVAGNMTARTEKALSAGCDMVLICNNRAGVHQVLEQFDSALLVGDDKLKAML